MSSYLAQARYGKDKVRVLRVVREGKTHQVVEYNVQVLLEGDMETRRAPFPIVPRGRFLRERTATRRRTTASWSRRIR
jgi:hypothetical protein